MEYNDNMIEIHPWEPFLPDGAKVLILGTFPPGSHRWSMEFYYPNRTNDFWKIMGLLFLGNKDALYDYSTKTFDLEHIRSLMSEHHIALHDSARKIRRLKGNASDKYLEILEPVPLYDLLAGMPFCNTVVSTGEKAAEVIATITGTEIPSKGAMIKDKNGLEIWRMPSTSRAYPMKLEDKASYYAEMFRHVGIM